jgi:hypothetical protein
MPNLIEDSEWLCDKAKAASEEQTRNEQIRFKKEYFANEKYICPDCGGRVYIKAKLFCADRLRCRDCAFNCQLYMNSVRDGLMR